MGELTRYRPKSIKPVLPFELARADLFDDPNLTYPSLHCPEGGGPLRRGTSAQFGLKRKKPRRLVCANRTRPAHRGRLRRVGVLREQEPMLGLGNVRSPHLSQAVRPPKPRHISATLRKARLSAAGRRNLVVDFYVTGERSTDARY
jgi:hypothetical protein